MIEPIQRQLEIEILKEKIRGRTQGKVLKIVQRSREEFVGVVETHEGKTYVVPDDKRLYVDIFLKDANVIVGEKVLVKLS